MMSEAPPTEPHVLDQPWRVWASVAVLTIVLAGALLGVVIIPVVQGRSAGLDAYTAICRALGILPGSPAVQQVVSRNPPTPVSQVVWTPDGLQILAAAKPERGRAKVAEVCFACHGENGLGVEAPLTPKPPVLAGQHADYLEEALMAYRTGRRKNVVMNGMAQLLSSEDVKVVAAYFAAQPSPLETAQPRNK